MIHFLLSHNIPFLLMNHRLPLLKICSFLYNVAEIKRSFNRKLRGLRGVTELSV